MRQPDLSPVATVLGIQYKDWVLHLKDDKGRWYLQWSFTAPDYAHGNTPTDWTSRKWHLSEHMTESEIVQTALAAALMAEEHEAREAFSYNGQRIFNPHISVAALQRACTELDVRA